MAISNTFARTLYRPLNRIERLINVFISSKRLKTQIESENYSVLEFRQLEDFLIRAFQTAEEKNQAEKQLIERAAQVAHDIRSPLIALDTASKTLTNLEEGRRTIISNAITRINDIANNLLNEYKHGVANKHPTTAQLNVVSKELLTTLLDSILSEKRLQYKSRDIKFKLTIADDAHGLFAEVNPINFKRIISNLVNNSVEAIADSGVVHVTLEKVGAEVRITVCDDGIGISVDNLAKIRDGGVSLGKKEGVGLGLATAIESIHKWHGTYDIQSELGTGTKFIINLPLSERPQWFQPMINLAVGMDIVILDDDSYIHDIWGERLKKYIDNPQNRLQIHDFYKIADFLRYQQHKASKVIYLIDHCLSDNKTGLELIAEQHLELSSFLVTSRYEDHKLWKRCIELGVKIAPKDYVPNIPINLISLQPEVIIIDDDKDLTDAWCAAGEQAGKRVMAFNDIAAASQYLLCYDRDIPIYVDYSLSVNIRGDLFAKQLHDYGFTNLFLATGYDADHFDPMPWLQGVVGKNPPF